MKRIIKSAILICGITFGSLYVISCSQEISENVEETEIQENSEITKKETDSSRSLFASGSGGKRNLGGGTTNSISHSSNNRSRGRNSHSAMH